MICFPVSNAGMRSVLVWLMAASVLLSASVMPAQQPVRMRASISQEKIVAGETVIYTIEIESDAATPVIPPDNPDFGGLQVAAGPRTSQRISIINGVQKAYYSYAFVLTATQPGTYFIPPIVVTVEGQTFKTDSYTIQVTADSLDAFPPTLQQEAILNARSLDSGINQQLRGRICLVPKVSDIQPFVGEPFTVKYILYMDPALTPGVQDYSLIVPKNQKLLAEEVPQGNSQKSFQPSMVDGREYNAVTYYEAVFTPTEAGETVIDGYGVRLQLLVQRRGGTGDVFSGGFFNNTISVDALAGPLKIVVRPVPEAGRPAGFSGTVGAYTLQGSLDRTEATLDDIITLTVKLTGRGNIAQAALPQLPTFDDFELFDQTQDTVKEVTSDGIGGAKTMEFLLRPRRAEKLTFPPLDYVLFNPDKETFETLTIPSAQVNVATGRNGVASVAPADSDESKSGGIGAMGLHYVKPVVDVTLRSRAPLIESPLYWTVQFAAMALAGWSFARARKRGLMDPVAVRRARAPEMLRKKLAACSAALAEGKTGEAALSLERALREHVGDLQNCSPEGLTASDILECLKREGFSAAAAEKVRATLDFCSSVRYAPVGSATDDLRRIMDASTAALLSGPEEGPS